MTDDVGQWNLDVSRAFVDVLVLGGLTHAIICPGSRSTPLAVALASHPHLKTYVLVDERSAAFFALGMARQLSRPVAILCTSGTAASNFAPAVIEASLSRVPLIVLTADRPPELRDWGAAQTIDQVHLYGRHAKWFVEMPVPNGTENLLRHAGATARRALETASAHPAGPVHINVPFREPLLPSGGVPPPVREVCAPDDSACPVRACVEPSEIEPPSQRLRAVADAVMHHPRGIIVAGPVETPGLARAVTSLGAISDYPILADPLSGLRFGPHDRISVIESYDLFLRDAEIAGHFEPELIIRLGAPPTSKPLQQFLERQRQARHILVDAGNPRDPAHLAGDVVHADPARLIARLAKELTVIPDDAPSGWITRWREADLLSRSVIQSRLAQLDELFEGRALAEVAAHLPDGATLMVGNSMPVRDADMFLRGDQRCITVVGNRGANGIDGVVSTALGAAAVSTAHVALVLGDLSFYHDMNGLLATKNSGIAATIVVLNNNGGGIFSFLPQAQQLDDHTFERLFGTPINLDVSRVANLYGCRYGRPRTWESFTQCLSESVRAPETTIIEVKTDRRRNLELHREVAAAVIAAVRSRLATAHDA